MSPAERTMPSRLGNRSDRMVTGRSREDMRRGPRTASGTPALSTATDLSASFLSLLRRGFRLIRQMPFAAPALSESSSERSHTVSKRLSSLPYASGLPKTAASCRATIASSATSPRRRKTLFRTARSMNLARFRRPAQRGQENNSRLLPCELPKWRPEDDSRRSKCEKHGWTGAACRGKARRRTGLLPCWGLSRTESVNDQIENNAREGHSGSNVQ